VLLALTTCADGDPINAVACAGARVSGHDARSGAARGRRGGASCGAVRQFPDAVVARCIETAAGNPLFLEQLLWAAQLGQSELPGRCAAPLARIERLTRAQRALHAAAVARLAVRGRRARHPLAEPAFDLSRSSGRAWSRRRATIAASRMH
jgi:hypothetical protein